MNTKIFLRYAFRETMGLVFMGVALFWSAGTVNWWQGWAGVAVIFMWVIATAIVILRYNPDLLAERLGPRKGAKSWDTMIMSLYGLIQLARYIVAGLDRRYGWTENFPLWVQIGALIICVIGYVLVVWATARNAFFSQIVRLQDERKHAVVTDGPYRYVRHPAYTGSILFELTVPILLTSWWALALSGVNACLMILRTALEDRTLHTELTGYTEYAHQTRFRLLPGIW
ncbi:MAG: isoprenylcysteine carboxylmethyltransferase family protein [Anaerolineales bacterium]|nr:isoprenylcysteine carboxylmethyltransferase family protein [Anaerolineales bacterium]